MLSTRLKATIRQTYRQISDGLPGFVPRKEQNFLVAEIAKTLTGEYDKQRRILVAEAGTGIGKSLLMRRVPSRWRGSPRRSW